MKTTKITCQTRQTDGSATLNTLRAEGMVPGVLYGLDENIHFAAPEHEVRTIVYTPDFGIVELEIDGTTYKCILKEYQRHPVTDEMVHIDMLALKKGRPVKVEIPVHFVGQCPGVKAGGTVVQKLRKVKIKTVPENLVEEFEVDISNLELGMSVRVRDIKVSEGIEVLNAGPMPLATIDIPRALKAAASKAAAEGADDLAEGEEGEDGEAQEGEEGGDE